MAVGAREPLRRTPRAHRRGEPRSSNTGRVDHARCSRRSKTASPSPRNTSRPLQEHARRLGTLVDDLFELARIDAGALSHELQVVAVAPLVDSCVRGVEAEARARGVKLDQRLGEAPLVRCAPDQVERVLLNLLTNALQHTPSDGAIAVMLDADDDHVTVSVEDTGSGLTPEAARRMFDRFWRSDPARSGGTGLGLAIARGLVEAQGGRSGRKEPKPAAPASPSRCPSPR